MREDDNNIVNLLKRLREDLDSLKNKQTVGATSLLVFDNQTTAAYDKAVSISEADTADINITFDAEVQSFAFTELYYLIYVDSLSTQIDTLYPSLVKVRQHRVNQSLPKRTVFSLILTSALSGTHTYYIKAHVLSTDRGTVS